MCLVEGYVATNSSTAFFVVGLKTVLLTILIWPPAFLMPFSLPIISVSRDSQAMSTLLLMALLLFLYHIKKVLILNLR